MRIGILTGGGDVPGLNPAIQQVTREACARGWEVVGIRNGWAGLLGINPDDETSQAARLMTLDPQTTRGIDRFGGTVLHTARLHPDTVREADMPDFLQALARYDERRWADMTPHILRVIEHLKLDALIPVGGDGTLSYAARLGEEGVPVLAIHKTMVFRVRMSASVFPRPSPGPSRRCMTFAARRRRRRASASLN